MTVDTIALIITIIGCFIGVLLQQRAAHAALIRHAQNAHIEMMELLHRQHAELSKLMHTQHAELVQLMHAQHAELVQLSQKRHLEVTKMHTDTLKVLYKMDTKLEILCDRGWRDNYEPPPPKKAQG